MIYAGVDIAKSNHVIDAIDDSGKELTSPLSFKNDEDGFERCIAWLEGIAECEQDVVIAMEATGSYWMALFSYLTTHNYTTVVVNPVHVKAVRTFKNQLGVKTDRIDSFLIAETLRLGEYDPTRLSTNEVQSLKTLTRYRQSIQEQIAQTKTKIVCLMDTYFPEYEKLFSDMFCASSLALLAKTPLPNKIARMKTPSLTKLLSETSRGRFGTEKAEQIKAVAKASIGIHIAEEAAAFEIEEYVRLLAYLEEQISRAEKKITHLLNEVEPLILTIPGISVTLGSQIVAEIGDVNRFKNAASIVKYAGLNSKIDESGEFVAQGLPITKAGSSYLRRALWLAAERAYRFDPKLGEFYAKKRAEGKCHRVAVTAIARKLCHIIYAVLRDQVPYDPER